MHILNMLLDLNIGTPSPTDCSVMDQIPLPCSKSVWQAETEAAWEKEYKRYLSTKNCGRILTVGDLRQSNNLDLNSLDTDIKGDLSEWAESVDSLGSLLLSGILS